MFYATAKPDHGLPHDPFKAIIAPRPIGWITAMSAKGEINLAPYSYFNGVRSRPPMVMFSSEGRKDSLEFSFSGLKTDVMRWVMKNGRPGDDRTLRDLCAAFQRRVVDTLVAKLVAAAQGEGVSSIVIAGGVAANRELRERAAARAGEAGLTLVVPPFRACTDNAAMIAYAGAKRLERGDDDTGRLETSPRTSLPRVTTKGRGKRRLGG